MLPLFFVLTTYKNEAEKIVTHIRNMIAVIPPAINIDISDDATVVVVVVVGNTA